MSVGSCELRDHPDVPDDREPAADPLDSPHHHDHHDQHQPQHQLDRPPSPPGTPRTKNLYRFTLNENLLTMKVLNLEDELAADRGTPRGRGQINDDADVQDLPNQQQQQQQQQQPQQQPQSPPSGDPQNQTNDQDPPEDDKISVKTVEETPITKPDQIPDSPSSCESKDVYNSRSIQVPCQNSSSNTDPLTCCSNYVEMRGGAFSDAPSPSSFHYRLHKQWDLHSLRSTSIRPSVNRSHGDLNLKELLQREENYLKTLRLNGDLRHRYGYGMTRPFGIFHHSVQGGPKEEHLQTLMSLLRIFNNKSEIPSKLNKGTDTMDSEFVLNSSVGDNNKSDIDQLKDKDAKMSLESVDVMDINRLKSTCSNMCDQLHEIHSTISHVHGDLKTLLSNISPSPSMCLMEEMAELREAYELTATNDSKRDLQIRKIEVQLHEICDRLEKASSPPRTNFLYSYVLVPVIGCVALLTLSVLGGIRKEPLAEVAPLASSIVERAIQ